MAFDMEAWVSSLLLSYFIFVKDKHKINMSDILIKSMEECHPLVISSVLFVLMADLITLENKEITCAYIPKRIKCFMQFKVMHEYFYTQPILVLNDK